jgi:hypothetical protein
MPPPPKKIRQLVCTVTVERSVVYKVVYTVPKAGQISELSLGVYLEQDP